MLLREQYAHLVRCRCLTLLCDHWPKFSGLKPKDSQFGQSQNNSLLTWLLYMSHQLHFYTVIKIDQTWDAVAACVESQYKYSLFSQGISIPCRILHSGVLSQLRIICFSIPYFCLLKATASSCTKAINKHMECSKTCTAAWEHILNASDAYFDT